MRSCPLLAVLCTLAPLGAQSLPTLTNPNWQRARAVWFGNSATPSIAAEVGFGCEALPWSGKLAKAWEQAGKGDRVPLGGTMWATLETFTDLQFGATKVSAGNYYVALERAADGWAMVLLDDEKVRAAQLEPGAVKAPVVATIPLQASHGSGDHLAAEWQPTDGGATLQLHCGAELLSATAMVQGSKGAFPLAQPEARRCSLATFANGGRSGVVPFAAIDHGSPPWNASREAAAKAMPIGKRWRLGQDWPTTLESNVALTIGGKKLPPGSWHLTMAKARKGAWSLVVSDAAADYAAKVDGFNPDGVTPVIEVPLRAEQPVQASDELLVGFATAGKETQLAITFGSMRFTAVVQPAPLAHR